MNDKISKIVTALYTFFSGFGLDAYPENTVPDEAQLPYITYQIAIPEWENPVALYARVWYRSTSFAAISAKVGEIDSAIGPGAVVPFEDGAIWLYKGTPFAQFMPMDGDPNLKCMYLNMSLQAITE
jgi:hypothetical protein